MTQAASELPYAMNHSMPSPPYTTEFRSQLSPFGVSQNTPLPPIYHHHYASGPPPPSNSYQPLHGQYFYYSPAEHQPIPGPSRRPSAPSAPLPTYPPYASYQIQQLPPVWQQASAQKRKRGDSQGSQRGREELKTPPNQGQISLPETANCPGKLPQVDSASLNSQTQLPTPPSSGRNLSVASLPSHLVPASAIPTQDCPSAPSPEKPNNHGVYVTSTEEEGRKLRLFKNSTGAETAEISSEVGPPRMVTTTVLKVDPNGVASIASDNVLESDLAWLSNGTSTNSAVLDSTAPDPSYPHTPTMENRSFPVEECDTPRTKKSKTTRRLKAFDSSSNPSEPMFSIRLDMGQGEPSRVALRKDIALAFIGLARTTDVIEETRAEDEDGWAVTDGPSRSKPLQRPEWLDISSVLSSDNGHRLPRYAREEKERQMLLRRYLEGSSDEEEDGSVHPSRKGKNVIRAAPQLAPVTTSQFEGWEIYPSDARAALLFTLRRAPPTQGRVVTTVPTGIINCPCKQAAPGSGSMISCSSCKTWHHLTCVGVDINATSDWVCDPCINEARRATLTTPADRTPRSSYNRTNERFSASAFRGNEELALAPSPLFILRAGAPLSEVRTPTTLGRNRARILSYGTDLWDTAEESPSTPLTRAMLNERSLMGEFATPPREDREFDVHSTPSRHLTTDPRIASQFNTLFPMTPLMGRSRNESHLLVADTPGSAVTPARSTTRSRNVSGVPPFSEIVTGRHEFLQGLAGERRGAQTQAPASPSFRRGPSLRGAASPSPFSHRRAISGNKFSHLRSSSRSGLGLGMPLDEDDGEDEATENIVRITVDSDDE